MRAVFIPLFSQITFKPFSYKLPFTALIPDDIDVDSFRVDITHFNYEQIEENVFHVVLLIDVSHVQQQKRNVQNVMLLIFQMNKQVIVCCLKMMILK